MNIEQFKEVISLVRDLGMEAASITKIYLIASMALDFLSKLLWPAVIVFLIFTVYKAIKFLGTESTK